MNILNALTFLKNKKGDKDKAGRYDIWRELLSMEPNEYLVTDGFWLII